MSKGVRSVSRTKPLLTLEKPHSTVSPPNPRRFHFNRSAWTLSLAYPLSEATMQYLLSSTTDAPAAPYSYPVLPPSQELESPDYISNTCINGSDSPKR